MPLAFPQHVAAGEHAAASPTYAHAHAQPVAGGGAAPQPAWMQAQHPGMLASMQPPAGDLHNISIPAFSFPPAPHHVPGHGHLQPAHVQHALPHQLQHGYTPGMPSAMHAPHRPAMAVAAATQTARSRTRLRWENILPLLTIGFLVAAAALFIKDREEILGGSASSTRTPKTVSGGGSAPAGSSETSTADVESQLQRAASLMQQGHYTEAGLILTPLAGTSDSARTLADQLASAEQRNARLLHQLGRLQARGDWRGVVNTLDDIRALHPLSGSQRRMLSAARAKLHPPRRASRRATSSTASRTRSIAPPPVATAPSSAPPSSSPPAAGMPPKPPSVPSGSSSSHDVMGHMNM